MAKFDQTNRGALFKNDEKGDNEKAPDYTGPLDVEGVDHRVAAWLRETKDGKRKFLSLQVEKKGAATGSSKAEDDDIPF
jgi:hypothetical protein